MMTQRALPVFLAVFGAAFAVIYVVAMEWNWAALTYHPRINEWGLGIEPPRNGPAMYWYGWLATSAAGAAVLGLAALGLHSVVSARWWLRLGWLVPAGAIVAAVYLMSPFFLR